MLLNFFKLIVYSLFYFQLKMKYFKGMSPKYAPATSICTMYRSSAYMKETRDGTIDDKFVIIHLKPLLRLVFYKY